MSARPLAFRYLYKSGVIKENTVTVFGELGSVFQKGTDYDEEVDLNVPYMDLSNLIMYYSGTVADGTVGSSVEGSLRNLNAPVSNVRKFLKFTNVDHASEANHYYIGDIVLFDPITAEGTSPNASCWTCVKTTSDILSPIPELANEIFDASAQNQKYNIEYKGVIGASGPGMTGIDNRGQRFITGVMPALYNKETGDIVNNPYWRESALAKSYLSAGNYYQGELVVYNGGVYQCKSTNGFLADPQLYQRVRYTVTQENNDAAGITNAAPEDLIPVFDPALAPQGAFGYDSSGTRYLMGVPPTGGLFSGLFWEPATLPKVPSGAYLNINWDNTSITEKLQFYDANVVGGSGAQSIPTFNDDVGNTITTLRKIYDDNEKSFVLTIANQILSSIPAAAIKSQAVNSKVEPDNTLIELVHLGPSNSKPSEYTPAVQGLFEESVARDMLRISGYANTITEILVTEGSSGYSNPPSVKIVGGLATNPKLVPFSAAAVSKLGVKSVKVNKTDATWNSASTGKRYGVGDVLVFQSLSTPAIACTAKVYRVDSAGNILTVLITNKGSGYSDVPKILIGGTERTFLEPILEVVSVDLQYRDTGFDDDMKVVVLFGSGSTAVGYAQTTTINGLKRLTGVKFDGGTHTDGSGFQYPVSSGKNYVSGKFKKDIVALQGYTSAGVLVSARSIAVITKVQAGAIMELVVINNGSGYTSNPSVVIAQPAADLRENAKLRRNAQDELVLDSFLPPINASGVYTNDDLVPTFSVIDTPVSADAVKVQGKAYLGLNLADVKFGGTGYSQGEYLSVTGGGITPAKFNLSYNTTTESYSALVMDGGDGYSFNSTKPYLNQIVLQNDTFGAPEGDQILAEIASVGGGIVELNFNNGRPTGEGFAVDDVITVNAATGPFRFTVTSVGDEGTIAPTGFTVVTDPTSVTGYTVGQTLLATAKFLSIDKLTLNTPQSYSAPNHPLVTIAEPTGVSTVSGWTKIPATATASLKVSGISITNAGTGYQLGDVITITQTGAVSCEAFVLALGNTETGSVGVIAIQKAGSGFDISKTTGDDRVKVNVPVTTGTPLAITVTYAVASIVVTNPGSGYEIVGSVNPVASIAASGNSVDLSVTTKKAGASTASFRVSAVNSTSGVPTISPLSPGEQYLVGDLLELSDADKNGVGAYITVQTTQSRGVKTGTIVQGYRGKGNVVSSILLDAACSKVGSTAVFPNIKYAVTKVTSPTSISSLTIVEYKPAPVIAPATVSVRYASPTSLSHKPQAVVKVAAVDNLGSILSLTVESKGYGYKSLPLIKPKPGTRGTGASLFAVSLGLSRVEFTGASLTVITSDDIVLSGDGIVAAPRKRPATAIAQLAGDLNTISTDPLKNPNILETLELLKPGSTSGYAQAKPNMGVSSVEVRDAGRGYNAGKDSNNNDITYIEVTEPDLPNGVKPTFDINFDSVGGLTNVVVLTSGRGYSKLPRALLKMSTGAEPNLPGFVILNMKLIDGYVTSGGEGYLTAPSITVTPPDVNGGNSVSTLLPTMKTSINGFNIPAAGAQYIATPEALVVGPGNGGEAVASMGISDIYVVNGGSGYAVGDMLVFPPPPGVDDMCANATVLETDTIGTRVGIIKRVGLVRSSFPVVAATLKTAKNDFIINGGSGYQLAVLPTSIVVPAAGELYNASGVPNPTLTPSAGTGAIFSTRLGVKFINFTSPGDGYESDATVLIQSPPSSQQANYSAVINGVGQLSAYVKNSIGSGYTAAPGVTVLGTGTGATVTPLMGVSEVSIITPGHGYRVGDVVTFTGGNPTEPANGVVTVIDRGGSGIGYDLNLSATKTKDDTTLSVDPTTGNIVGMVGAIEIPLILEGGYDFEVGDIISLLPETRFPTQSALDSIRTVQAGTSIAAGKLTSIRLINNEVSNDFKAGMILKVTSLNPTLSAAIAYIRVNVVVDDISGTGWHSINTQYADDGVTVISYGSYISTPGDKYGRLVPGLWYDYDNIQGSLAYIGIQGDPVSLLASNAEWGSDLSLISNNNLTYETQKLKFEVVTQDEVKYPDSTAYFKVTQTLKSVGAIIQAVPCTKAGVTTAGSSGLFYSLQDLHGYTGVPRGRISFIQVLNPGTGYQSAPTAVITSATKNIDAKLVVTLGVVDLRIDNRGLGFTSSPTITIDAPYHRALTAKGYARSAVFDIDGTDTFEVLDQGTGYTGESLDNTGATVAGGTYRLVGGALHQTGGSAESIDTVLTMRPGAFSAGKLSTDAGTVQTATDTLIRGSNYRVGDVVTLMPTGTTTSGNLATPAKIRITKISKILDTSNGLTNNNLYNTGSGILDFAIKYPAGDANGEDVGAYGTGYFEPPYVTILGGNQGVTLATSLGLVAVDLLPNQGSTINEGSDYQVGDLIQMISPEFSDPVDVGIVSKVNLYGSFISATIYEPFSKGLNKLPSISIVRASSTYVNAERVAAGFARMDAVLLPVLGVTIASTTTSSDGFIGRPYVFVEPPNGMGYIQQPTSARITPNVVNEVSAVSVFYDNETPEYTVTVPRIAIAPPPTVEKYSGWRSVRFNKDDSFEAIVQYTIAKAVSFQVDPDATLPGYYFTASAITIGGVVIPLRQSGGKGMQGRELSANRIIRRYKVKLIAV